MDIGEERAARRHELVVTAAGNIETIEVAAGGPDAVEQEQVKRRVEQEQVKRRVEAELETAGVVEIRASIRAVQEQRLHRQQASGLWTT